ncbi:MAG: DUF4352 domain-containing protein [archaeon]
MSKNESDVNVNWKDKTGPLGSFLKSMGTGAGACIGICIGAVIIVLLLTAGLSNDDGQAVVANGVAGASASGGSAPEAETAVFGIGEKFVYDGVAYTVLSVGKKSGVGSFSTVEAKGEFVIVELEVENQGVESKYVTLNLQLVDNLGRKFDSDSTAEIYIGNGFYLGEKLQPGLPVSGFKVFDVPMTATGLKLEIKGNWSSKAAALVELG